MRSVRESREKLGCQLGTGSSASRQRSMVLLTNKQAGLVQTQQKAQPKRQSPLYTDPYVPPQELYHILLVPQHVSVCKDSFLLQPDFPSLREKVPAGV